MPGMLSSGEEGQRGNISAVGQINASSVRLYGLSFPCVIERTL